MNIIIIIKITPHCLITSTSTTSQVIVACLPLEATGEQEGPRQFAVWEGPMAQAAAKSRSPERTTINFMLGMLPEQAGTDGENPSLSFRG